MFPGAALGVTPEEMTKIRALMQQHADANPDFKDHLDAQGIQVQQPEQPEQADNGEINDVHYGPVDQKVMEEASKPSFRHQDNAHDTEVAQIKNVLDSIEKSQAEDRAHSNSNYRRAILNRGAQAVSNQMGGLPLTDTGPLPERIQKGDQELKRAKLGEEMKQDLFKRENPEDERLNKWLIAQMNAQERAKLEADRETHQTEEKKKDRALRESEGTLNRENARNIGAGHDTSTLGAAAINTGGKISQEVGRTAAQETFRQGERQNLETYNGIKFHARGMLNDAQTSHAVKRMDNYGAMAPAMDRALALLQKDPSGKLFWGSDARSDLLGAITQAADAEVKFAGDGVANGKDMTNVLTMMGNPQSFEEALAHNGVSALKAFRRSLDEQLKGAVGSVGYDLGEGESSKLGDVSERAGDMAKKAGAAAGAGSGGNVDIQPYLDAADAARSGKKGNVSPQPRGGGSTPPKKEDKKPAAGGGLMYVPGKGAVEVP